MIFGQALQLKTKIKADLEKYLSILKLCFATPMDLPVSMSQTMDHLENNEIKYRLDLHEFIKLCDQDPRSTRDLRTNLRDYLSAPSVLITFLALNKSLLNLLPQEFPPFMVQLHLFFQKLLSQFDGFPELPPVNVPSPFPGNGSYMYDSATGTHVQFSARVLPQPQQQTSCSKAEAGPEAADPGTETFAEPEAPQGELPECLQGLPLKPKDKLIILRLLEFSRRRQLDYKGRVMVLVYGGATEILKEFMNWGEVDKLIDKLAGHENGCGRQPQGFRSSQNQNSTQKRYKNWKNEDLKAQVKALL